MWSPLTLSAANAVTLYAVAARHGAGSLAIGTADNASASLQISTTNFWLFIPATFNAPGALPLKVDATSFSGGNDTGFCPLKLRDRQSLPAPPGPAEFDRHPILLSDTQSLAPPSTSPQTVYLGVAAVFFSGLPGGDQSPLLPSVA